MDQDSSADSRDRAVAERIVALRDGGAAWKEIEEQFGFTRQQARYAYQLGKRVERRQERRQR